MAAAPRFKIVNPSGEYVASCKYAEDASFLVSALGNGTKVYDREVSSKALLYTQGVTGDAGESADRFASLVHQTIEALEKAQTQGTKSKFYIWLNQTAAQPAYWRQPAQNWTTEAKDATFFDTRAAAEAEAVYAERVGPGEAVIARATKNI